MISDENFHGDIVRGLRRRIPSLDLIRVQDAGLSGINDPALLAWAVEHDRILLTHDRTTMPAFWLERLLADTPVPGVFIVNDRASLGRLIDELAVVIECSEQSEWRGQVLYLPLR